jgi:cupin fold WbuC family metalloprotein
MIVIDKKLTDKLTEEAVILPRKRKNHNFHRLLSDPMNRMLHAMEPETYVQPHKHENPDKREAFIILKGKVAVVEFDNEGNIREHIILDPVTGNYGAEIQPRTWHCLIALEKGSLVYEVKDGPYDPSDDKFFASWAPAEGDAGTENYKNALLAQMNSPLERGWGCVP